MEVMDWIQGERFISIAAHIYTPNVKDRGDYYNIPNTLDLTMLHDGDIIYTHTMYALQLLLLMQNTARRYILITHNADTSITDEHILLMDKNLIRWYAQNVDCVHDKIQAIPIGLENERWFRGLQKKERMLVKMQQRRQFKNLLYLNCNVITNPVKRTPLYNLFANKKWVTARHGRNGSNFNEYLDDIYNHWFVLCPEGNGIDTHRTWETLYMGSIPIERRNRNNKFFCDLPICFVDDWSEITPEFLEYEYARINALRCDKQMLTFDYWQKLIINGN